MDKIELDAQECRMIEDSASNAMEDFMAYGGPHSCIKREMMAIALFIKKSYMDQSAIRKAYEDGVRTGCDVCYDVIFEEVEHVPWQIKLTQSIEIKCKDAQSWSYPTE